MVTSVDIAPLAGTVWGGFFIGFITGYAIKKVIKLAAVIIGLFIAALAYFEYQHVINVDWSKVQHRRFRMHWVVQDRKVGIKPVLIQKASEKVLCIRS